MSKAEIDWNGIQKALDVELSRGCMNIQGNQYLFHEFLVVSLQNPPTVLPSNILREWWAITQKFSMYPNLDYPNRQDLIKSTQYLCALIHNYLLALETLMSLKNSKFVIKNIDKIIHNSSIISNIISLNQTIDYFNDDSNNNCQNEIDQYNQDNTNVSSNKKDINSKEQSSEKTLLQKAYSVKDIQKKYLRAYESWTQDEDQQLIFLYKEGLTISNLVKILQRQPGGIKARLKKLGLL